MKQEGTEEMVDSRVNGKEAGSMVKHLGSAFTGTLVLFFSLVTTPSCSSLHMIPARAGTLMLFTSIWSRPLAAPLSI